MAVLYSPDGTVNDKGFSFTTATANNPFLCAVGLESCRILVEENMAEKSQRVGDDLRRRLASIDGIKVRGIGSMVFVSPTQEPAPSAAPMESYLRETEHILTRAHGSTLVLMPPFVTAGDTVAFVEKAIRSGVDRLWR
jgi:adenosylmethionine-8-amino-7-oxononanoate aminotransferase